MSGGQPTRYVGGDYEIAPDGTVTKYLIGGKQVGTSFFIHHSDHLGSIQAVTDAAGVEVRRQDHTPFGNQHYAWGSHAESKGWIGEREEETELVYLNARYYDPEIGRFTALDPVARLGQGLNRYAYSLNSPVNLLDPSGLDPETRVCASASFDGGRTQQGGCSTVIGFTVTVRAGEVIYYSDAGVPVNSIVSDSGEYWLQLQEEDAENWAAYRRMLDNIVGCSPLFVETCGGLSGGGGDTGNTSVVDNTQTPTTTLTYCQMNRPGFSGDCFS